MRTLDPFERIVSGEAVYFGNSVASWLTALAVTTAVALLVRFLCGFLARRLGRNVPVGTFPWKDAGRRVLGSIQPPFAIAAGIACSLPLLELPGRVLAGLRGLLMVIVVVQAGIAASKVLSFLVDRTIAERPEDGARAMTVRAGATLARVLLFVVLAIVVLDNFGVNVTALVAGLGVGGIAIALAVQRILGDVLASLTIVLDRPFVIGDFVTVGNAAGTIEEIGLKTTRIRSISGEQLIYPNAELLQGTIANFKRMIERRIVFRFGVAYETPPEKLRQIPNEVKAIVDSIDVARFDRCHFLEFADSSLTFEVVYFVRSPEFLVHADTRQAINLRLLERLGELGVAMAFPTRTVHLASVPATATLPR